MTFGKGLKAMAFNIGIAYHLAMTTTIERASVRSNEHRRSVHTPRSAGLFTLLAFRDSPPIHYPRQIRQLGGF